MLCGPDVPGSSMRKTQKLNLKPGVIGYGKVPGVFSKGAFVDLGHQGGGWFSGPANPFSQLTYPYNFNRPINPRTIGLKETVYDTWTPSYENDRLDQDGWPISNDTDAPKDQGQNNLNEDSHPWWGILNNGDANQLGSTAPDDDSERETRPPYPYPIRGVKVSIRLIEKTTNQVYQSSVVHSYVPE